MVSKSHIYQERKLACIRYMIHYVQMVSKGQWKPGIHCELILTRLRRAAQGGWSLNCACVVYVIAEGHGKQTTLAFISQAILTHGAKLLKAILFLGNRNRDETYFGMLSSLPSPYS